MILHDIPADSNNTLSPPQLLENGWPAAWIAEDPDAAATSPEAVYQAAQRYIAAGLSCIPIETDEGSKSPDPRRLRSWKIFQLRLPREEEVRDWYEIGGPFGLAVLGGPVSGGQKNHSLEILDFDSIDLAAPWIEQVEQRAPGLTSRLVMVLSPRPGLHVYFRSPVLAECQKLAALQAWFGQDKAQNRAAPRLICLRIPVSGSRVASLAPRTSPHNFFAALPHRSVRCLRELPFRPT